MSQPCIQQTAVRVHQLADSEVEQLFLSLCFRCPKPMRRAHAQSEHQNYHVVLLSLFVFLFFLILEWTAPLSAQSPRTSIQQEPAAPASTQFNDAHGLHLIHWDQE